MLGCPVDMVVMQGMELNCHVLRSMYETTSKLLSLQQLLKVKKRQYQQWHLHTAKVICKASSVTCGLMQSCSSVRTLKLCSMRNLSVGST